MIDRSRRSILVDRSTQDPTAPPPPPHHAPVTHTHTPLLRTFRPPSDRGHDAYVRVCVCVCGAMATPRDGAGRPPATRELPSLRRAGRRHAHARGGRRCSSEDDDAVWSCRTAPRAQRRRIERERERERDRKKEGKNGRNKETSRKKTSVVFFPPGRTRIIGPSSRGIVMTREPSSQNERRPFHSIALHLARRTTTLIPLHLTRAGRRRRASDDSFH